MTDFSYDDSDWPILLVTEGPGVPSPNEYRAHWAQVLQYTFPKREPFVLLIDDRKAEKPDAIRRKIIAETMQRSMQANPGNLRGVGVILGSKFDQGVLTAITWLVRPPYPMSMFSDVPKAKVWAIRMLPDLNRSLIPRAMRSIGSTRPPPPRD